MFKKHSQKTNGTIGSIAGKIADSKVYNLLQRVMFFGAPTTNELADELEQKIKVAEECIKTSRSNSNSKWFTKVFSEI